MIEQKSIIKQVCIGANRYVSARGKAMYINCLESYPNDDDNAFGEYSVQHRCNYDDYNMFLDGKKPSFDNPQIVTCEGKFEVFAGNKQFSVEKIIDVQPFKASVKQSGSASTTSKPA